MLKTKEQQVAALKALLEAAYDAQHDAQARVERLEARLRKLTGCDCAAMGITCAGHVIRADAQRAMQDIGTERNRA